MACRLRKTMRKVGRWLLAWWLLTGAVYLAIDLWVRVFLWLHD